MANENQLTSLEILPNERNSSKYSSNQILQNFVLVWFNPRIDNFDQNWQYICVQRIISVIHTFSDADECVDFLTDIENEKVFLILSNVCSHELVPLIYNMPLLYSIYLFCDTAVEYDKQDNKWKKVRGPFSEMESICKTLKQDLKQYDHDLLSFSIVPPGDYLERNSYELPASFMYSQIFKEILVNMQHDDDAKENLVHFWYKQYQNNEAQIRIIGEFDRDYNPDSAIRWYTRQNFIYSMLNQALRKLDIEVMIEMGFFLRDLCRQIEQLYIKRSHNQVPLTVYRGQGILNDEFLQLRESQRGLLSFNNFLSTSKTEEVAKFFCPIPPQNPDITAILFKIQIDPNDTCAPFVALDDHSQFEDEKEILFSMHSVFRIVRITQIKEYLWQVELKSTNDNDEELKKITKYIREELSGRTGWHQLGHLLLRIGNFDKAEEIYQMLLKQANEDDVIELYSLYNQLGLIKHYKGNYTEANILYEKHLKIEKRVPLVHIVGLSTTYNNIASVHLKNGKYSDALIFYKRALEIEERFSKLHHSDLAVTYNNIGTIYKKLGNYTEAITFYEKALLIYHETRPLKHPDFILIYNNIAEIYCDKGEYEKALELQRQAVKVAEKSLLSNHPYLANIYGAIGLTQKKRGEYSKALKLYNKALKIYQENRYSDHTDLAILYNNMATLHLSQNETEKALNFYQKTLDIEQKFLPENHPTLAFTHNNIANVYCRMKEYSKSLDFSNKALEIWKESNSPPHSIVAAIYSNIALVYHDMGQYQEALSFFHRSLTIFQGTLPSGHPEIEKSKENIVRTNEKIRHS